MMFVVTTKDDQTFSVRAGSYQQAAKMAARKLYKRTPNVTAMRTTGSPQLDGWFSAYQPTGDGALTSLGDGFLVRRE